MRTASFRATIRRIGAKAVVDIPARVSEAFSGHAHSGRVTVEGTLGGAPLQATLMPVAGGRHRLFVNEAMRRAAGAEAGDTVGILLRPATGSRAAAGTGSSRKAKTAAKARPSRRTKPAGKAKSGKKPGPAKPAPSSQATPRSKAAPAKPAAAKPARSRKRRPRRRQRKKKS